MLEETRTELPAEYPEDLFTEINEYVSRVKGEDMSIGPNIALKVMACDKFNIRVSSWYSAEDFPIGNDNVIAVQIISALLPGLSGMAGNNTTESQLEAHTEIPSNVGDIVELQNTSVSEEYPAAFLIWVLFDEQFNYLVSSSGYNL